MKQCQSISLVLPVSISVLRHNGIKNLFEKKYFEKNILNYSSFKNVLEIYFSKQKCITIHYVCLQTSMLVLNASVQMLALWIKKSCSAYREIFANGIYAECLASHVSFYLIKIFMFN